MIWRGLHGKSDRSAELILPYPIKHRAAIRDLFRSFASSRHLLTLSFRYLHNHVRWYEDVSAYMRNHEFV